MEAIAQHWLTDAQPVSEQWPLRQLPPCFSAEQDATGLECPSGHFSCPDCAAFHLTAPLASSLAGQGGKA